MKYQVERIKSCIYEISQPFLNHWAEIAGHQDTVPLDPDFARYQRLEDDGMLRIFTARNDSILIGYFITFISPHIHYKSTIYGINDILYVHPDHRGGTVGYRLMKGAMADLKTNCNVDILVIHMKIKHEFRKLLIALGFSLAEENWEAQL